jgi:hypothetical protein
VERLPLIGGSYTARWVGASAQRCINYFPELNPPDALVPVTHYQRPGLAPLAQGPIAPVRGLFRASNMRWRNGAWSGRAYAIIGDAVLDVSPTFALTQIGTVTPGLTNLVSYVDNGTTGLLVDGSPNGLEITLASNTTAPVADTTGTFQGSDRVDYLDTFIVGNTPGTNQFWTTHSNSLVFDPLYIAAKTDWPDPIASLIVNRHELLLLGEVKSEIWYDAGNPLYPLAELPGAYIEHGLAAIYSLASNDISVFWLHQDSQGQGMVLRQRGYDTKRVSNHALEYALKQMAKASTIYDAIGYCFQIDGHAFYVLHFPSGDQTWVFDDSMIDPVKAWHQEAWTDSNGVLHRHRGNCFANLWGKLCVGDYANGTIYEMDQDTYVDTVNEVPSPISCIRSFPHIAQGRMAGTLQPVGTNGQRILVNKFWLDLECGNAPESTAPNAAEIGLRFSIDKGRSWKNTVLQSAGAPGQYETQPQWQQPTGIARDIVFEISHSIAGASACNGAWIDCEVLDT